MRNLVLGAVIAGIAAGYALTGDAVPSASASGVPYTLGLGAGKKQCKDYTCTLDNGTQVTRKKCESGNFVSCSTTFGPNCNVTCTNANNVIGPPPPGAE